MINGKTALYILAIAYYLNKLLKDDDFNYTLHRMVFVCIKNWIFTSECKYRVTSLLDVIQ